MPRGATKMEKIEHHKSCIATFQKRSKSLFKKAWEFSTLCGVDACVIIYGPESSESETWPENLDEVRNIINRYKGTPMTKLQRPFRLDDFFAARKKKADNQFDQVRKGFYQAKYPTWDEYVQLLSEKQLGFLLGKLDSKIEHAMNRIKMMKMSWYLMEKATSQSTRNHCFGNQALVNGRLMEAEVGGGEEQPVCHQKQLMMRPLDHSHPPKHFRSVQDSQGVLPMSLNFMESDMVNLRASSCNQFGAMFMDNDSRQVYFDPNWIQGNAMFNNTNSLMSYYSSFTQPLMPRGDHSSQVNGAEGTSKVDDRGTKNKISSS